MVAELLTPTMAHALRKDHPVAHYTPGQTLCYQNLVAEGVWVLLHGVLMCHDDKGHSDTICAPALIGRMECLTGAPYPCTIQAKTLCQLVFIGRWEWMRLCAQSPIMQSII